MSSKTWAKATCTRSWIVTGTLLRLRPLFPIPEGQPGVCKVRFNRAGTLFVPWGYVGGVQCDPIEKKPFFHAYPGALAYTFGMLGCDLHCGIAKTG